MMKKLLTTLLISCIAHATSFAQPTKRYLMSYATGSSYAPLSSGATDVGFPIDWDDEVSNAIAMPFPFQYQNVPVTQLHIETYGSIFLNDITPGTDIGQILGINCDYESKNRGKVYYETTGPAGNRIFKVEFRNVGLYIDTLGLDTLNFQIWLYENDYAIEYRAGYSNVPSSVFAQDFSELTTGKEFIVSGLLNNPGDSLATTDTSVQFFHTASLTGVTFNDYVSKISHLNTSNQAVLDNFLLKRFPPLGSVIRMVPNIPSSIGDINNQMATIYPNPSTDGIFTVQLESAIKDNVQVMVFNVAGQQIFNSKMQGNNQQIDLSQAPAGTYFCRIINGEQTGVFELVRR